MHGNQIRVGKKSIKTPRNVINCFQIAKDDLFVQMQNEFVEAGMSPLEIPSPQTFLYMWRTEFPHLKMPRHNTLGVCDTCSFLKKDIRSLPARSAEWQNLQTTFKAHLVQVRNERHAQIERDQGIKIIFSLIFQILCLLSSLLAP
jgi:hypothetical protein